MKGGTTMVGKNIARLRKEAGMTQEELAEKLNVTRQAISSWERERTEPDLDTVQKAAAVFDVPAEELIYGAKKKPKAIHTTVSVGKDTVGFGTVLAIAISLVKWHSIKWAILHGVFSWGYVIYYVIKYGWGV